MVPQNGEKVPYPEGPHPDELTFSWSSSAPGFVNPGNEHGFYWAVPSDTPNGDYEFLVSVNDKALHGGDDPAVTATVIVKVRTSLTAITGPNFACQGSSPVYTVITDPERVAACVKWSATGGIVETTQGRFTAIHWTSLGDQTVTATVGGVALTLPVRVSPSDFTAHISGPTSITRGQIGSYTVTTSPPLDPVKDRVRYYWKFQGDDGTVVSNYDTTKPYWTGVMVQSGWVYCEVESYCTWTVAPPCE